MTLPTTLPAIVEALRSAGATDRRRRAQGGPRGEGRGALWPRSGPASWRAHLRCRRCGRKLTLRYSGTKHDIPRYSCSRGWMDNGEPRCIAFGGLRVDDAIEDALLTVVGPGAISAAVAAEKEANQRRDQVRAALKRDLEAARYATDRAFRQYDAADRANQLVAGELEARWNKALARVAEVEGKLVAMKPKRSHQLPIRHRSPRLPRTSRPSGPPPRLMRG
jgi:hypothetical protein